MLDSWSQSMTRPSKGGEPRARLAPGDLDLLDAVLRAVAPRHISDEDSLVLASIQMAPSPQQRIVPAASLPTFRALERRLLAALEKDLDDLAFGIQFYLHNFPRSLNAKDFPI